jgi:glycosyltransferase involved in cell wall biosynthesis
LEALRCHAAAGHEVIIVDNAPTSDSTAALVADYPYQYICEPRPGQNYARNRGAAVARYPIIAYTDDDCVPDPNWLLGLTAPYADPQVGATTGLVMPLELETPAQQRFEDYSAHRRIFQERVFRAPQLSPSMADKVGIGANMSVRRPLLDHLGGFDVRFDGGTPTLSGGDTELFSRVLASGATIVYRPDALVWHRHRRDMPGLRQVIFGYGVGFFAVLWKRLLEDSDYGVLFTIPRCLAGLLLKTLWGWLWHRPSLTPELLLFHLWGDLHGLPRYLAARHLADSANSQTREHLDGCISAQSEEIGVDRHNFGRG